MKQTLMGNDAIALGMIHSNIDMVSGYPGTPSSEILTNVQKLKAQLKLDLYAQWATNEKVGFEVAYAGAIAGRRAAATMKQVGLNVASDPLMSAAYIGNLGAFVLIVADDPGFHSSQTEQDSRVFAKFAKIPVLDPATPQDAYDFVSLAVDISEKFQTPTMLRPVMRVCHARQIVEVKENHEFNPKKGKFQREISRWAAVPRAGRLRQGYEMIDRINAIKEYNWEELIKPEFEACKGGKLLVLTSGTGYGFAKEALEDLGIKADIVKFKMPYPLPENKIREQFANYEHILVVEEPMACIEEQIMASNVHGRLDNTMNVIDELQKIYIQDALTKLGLYKGENLYPSIPFKDEIPARPPNLCPGCPHRDVYYSIMKVFKKKKSIYPSDIGCYTLAINQEAIDTVLCMGASVSMASGFSIADPEKYTVATIGDSTFFHGGIPPLINAVYQKHKFLLVILDNSVVAMTGRQKPPQRQNGEVDIVKIAEGCGAETYEYVYSNDLNDTISFFKKMKEKYENATGPIVAVVREFCVLDKEVVGQHIHGEFAKVIAEECVACDHCTTIYKCPPMGYNEEGKVEIDPFLCIGCGSCLNVVCPTEAFTVDEERSK
ncbi:thiamine pyrophosphate-dependent enzyme [Halarcobacter ebronensis]|uniref:Indolepyruvate oxidoreductase subunit IorA n=1 Tax=Halarcobacter ebronensis TaxID=1462615 RepID=A0A4Q1ATD1_9BACT|nr:thiamine pyrophosphate-dependent enzyme [Halarcobacter ebronensis]QKF81954.1 indolepyruvate ferredoxin oxidoreductase, alpha subunit [Halarcobacter ebronensis]RXK04328.1 indolepyruvate oxidoreductase [Halarcobacter ebronensis]